jgi:hypothetical protein
LIKSVWTKKYYVQRSEVRKINKDQHCDESSSDSHSVDYLYIHSFMVYLTTLLVIQTIQNRIIQYLKSAYPPTNARNKIRLIHNS